MASMCSKTNELSPFLFLRLKQVLRQVEHKLGRVRDPNNKSAPRTIDLDISFWGNTTCEYKLKDGCAVKSWSIPDPDTHKHAHLIIPLADVTPEFIHPSVKKPLKVIAREVSGKDNFRSFFPVNQLQVANGDHAFTSTSADKPFTHAVHSTEFSENTKSPVALVTGAAKRLGACIAKRLHKTGYNVLVHCSKSISEAGDLVEQMNR